MTEKKRRQDRDVAKEKAKEALRAGKIEEARREFSKAVDITHEHAVELMKECRKLGVDCITAMYEADSQLAYLNKIGLAEYIISEDSDLILFGCTKILFKLQLNGSCTLFEAEKLYLTLNTTEEKFSVEKFRRICILSGCDYLNSLHGIGLAKARKFMMMTEETDMKRALLKIPTYLNMKKLTITDEYIDGFIKAEATFKYQIVYDPLKREMVRLNPFDENDNELDCCANAGEFLNPAIAYQMALGNLNPRSLQKLDDFDPDKPCQTPAQLRKSPSIWKKGRNVVKEPSTKAVTQQASISNFFSNPASKHKQLAEVQNIIGQENDVTNEVVMEDLLSTYCVTEIAPSKRRNSDYDEEMPEEEKAPRNPFAKKTQSETKKTRKSWSLLDSLVKTDSATQVKNFGFNETRVVSRFFAKKSNSETPNEIENKPNLNTSAELLLEVARGSLVHEENKAKQREFYAMINQDHERREKQDSIGSLDSLQSLSDPYSLNDSHVDTEETDLEASEKASQVEERVVNLDDYEFRPKSQKQTFINDLQPKTTSNPSSRPQSKHKSQRPGLSKVKSTLSQKSDDSSVQTKLSKFGFQKKSAFT